jgi:hypothetical protein
VLCFELLPDVPPTQRDAIQTDLRAIAQAHDALRGIETFLCHPGFPVDIRHNAKIGREKLAVWAARQLEQQP